jgi:hypothetical protein
MLGGLVVLAMAQESRPAPAAQDAPRELGAQVGGG